MAKKWVGSTLVFCLSIIFSGCPKDNSQLNPSIECYSHPLSVGTAPETGAAYVFIPDPIVSSFKSDLSPTSRNLNAFRKQVSLARLTTKGVLEGLHVDVRDRIHCKDGYGAYSKTNDFKFDHSNAHFQEAMTYYYGDEYRAWLDASGVLYPKRSIKIISHCEQADNAYYLLNRGAGSFMTEYVCLGDSKATPGAFYSDDASTITHELQHATTIDAYSPLERVDGFIYDPWGALNESISDFMSLMFTDAFIPSPFDSKVFSRWALGTFIPGRSGIRGAHRCPVYDSDYPRCANYPQFSSDRNTFSYSYPDGLGWPYANNFDPPAYGASVFKRSLSQEEIHNTGMLMTGAFFDVYETLKINHSGNVALIQKMMSKLMIQTLINLPKPSLANLSPVTFRGFVLKMVSTAQAHGWSSNDLDAMLQALSLRGLYAGELLPEGWASVGAGAAVSPGLKIQDRANDVQSWLAQRGADPSQVHQGISTINGRLDPGEVVAVWFDVNNLSPQTAGSVNVKVRILDEGVQWISQPANLGLISPTEAHLYYAKINGTSIVSALSSTNPTFHIPSGNSYFKTNPFFDQLGTTAFFMKVDDQVAQGKLIRFKVQLQPDNGALVELLYSTAIN